MGVVLYYVVPALLAILLLASLKLKAAYKINLAVLCVSLVASAYAAELILRSTSSAPSGSKRPLMFIVRDAEEKQLEAAKLAEQFDVKIDTREGLEVVADLRRQGADAIPFVSPSNDLFLKQPNGDITSAVSIHGDEVIPLGGISKKVTILCNENGQWITYMSDEHGFNNPNEIWRSEHVEIAALGDSFAQGYCVPTERSFVGLIRQRVPATINLGMAGDGPLMMLATLNEYLPLLKPKIVLWFYFEGNDLINLQDEKKSRVLIRYLEDDFNQPLLARRGEIDQAMLNDISRKEALGSQRRVVRLANRDRVLPDVLAFVKLTALRRKLQLIRSVEAQELELMAEVAGANMDLFRDILSRAKTRVDSWGGTLHFVYLPSWTRYFDTPEIGVKERTQVLSLVNSLGIPLIDIHPAFQAQSDLRSLFPFRETGHYNERGHQIVADEVLKTITSGNQSR
jgi:lysophospholipase L1-like esterase